MVRLRIPVLIIGAVAITALIVIGTDAREIAIAAISAIGGSIMPNKET